MKRALLSSLLLMMLASSLPAATVLEGYWENQLWTRKVSELEYWDVIRPGQDWRYPASYFEFKLRNNIGNKGELWAKTGVKWESGQNDDPQPAFTLYEGHLKFRHDWDSKAAELYLFTREYRYWIGNHLLELVHDNGVKNGDNNRGFRAEAWLGGWNLAQIGVDFYDNDNRGGDPRQDDDLHLTHIGRTLGDKGSFIGATFLQKTEGNVSADFNRQYNRVWSSDLQWVFPFGDLSAEYAESSSPAEGLEEDSWAPNYWHEGDLGRAIESLYPRDSAMRAELRNLTLSHPNLGSYSMNLGYWHYGPDYRNYLGNGDIQNKIGNYFHTYYRLPKKAVTYTISWGKERRVDSFIYAYDEQQDPLFTEEPRHWLLHNLYIEFINGFKFSLSHNRNDETSLGIEKPKHDWLAELVVENRLAWLKTQFKIKDWDTRDEKRFFGLETTVNLTDQWKWYNRYMVANDRERARSMVFTQLQYRPHDNMELNFAYGPPEYGDWGELTNDPDFESTGQMRDEFQIMLKTWF
jgi:hypothetical protein